MPFTVHSPDGAVVLSYGVPMPAPLPELVTIPCKLCRGDGFILAPDPMLSERCTGCYGAKVVEVCPDCKETPDGASDLCGCTCETCERPVHATELRDGICPTCFAEGAANIRRETEEYQAWVVEQMLV